MTAAVVSAAIALGGCPHKRPQSQPVPGPQSAPMVPGDSRGGVFANELRAPGVVSLLSTRALLQSPRLGL